MPATVPGDQIINLPAAAINMTGVAPGMLASNSGASVQVVPIGTGLDASSGTLVCTVTGNVQANWNGTGLAAILNQPTLATVATSGSYADLSSKPSIPAAQVQSDWNASSGLGVVLNKPTVPTNTNQLTNGAGFLTTNAVTSVNGQTGIVVIATPSTLSFAQGVARSLVSTTASTGFQVSSSRVAIVHYTSTVGTTATIGGASAGMIYFETAATNSVTPSDWTIVSQMGNSQTITLAVALQSAQTVTETVAGLIPIGYYARLRTSNVSGTPSFTYVTGQEVLL